jgi:Mg2+-importing ATPase
MSPEAALHHLQVTDAGLTTGEAYSRLVEKGANLLSVKKPPTWWQLLLSIIPNPFNILLGLLAIISVATPPPAWSTFILLVIMIVISCAVRFWQEYRSTVAAIRLQAKVSTDVRVRRRIDGLKSEEVVVDEKTLVPGDILMVDPGDAVPADCLILEASSLQISQSRFAHRMFATIFPLTQCSLTGESESVRKTAESQGMKESAVFELGNIIFMGTSVVSGSGVALVLRTGDGKCILKRADRD